MLLRAVSAPEIRRDATSEVAARSDDLRLALQPIGYLELVEPGCGVAEQRVRHGPADPDRHSCEGEDRSPPLARTDLPAGAVSLALIVDDRARSRHIHTPDRVGNRPGRPRARRGRARTSRGPQLFRRDGLSAVPAARSRDTPICRQPLRTGERDGVPPDASRRDLEPALTDRVLAVAELVGTYKR